MYFINVKESRRTEETEQRDVRESRGRHAVREVFANSGQQLCEPIKSNQPYKANAPLPRSWNFSSNLASQFISSGIDKQAVDTWQNPSKSPDATCKTNGIPFPRKRLRVEPEINFPLSRTLCANFWQVFRNEESASDVQRSKKLREERES